MTPQERIDKVWAEWDGLDGLDMDPLMEATRVAIQAAVDDVIERHQRIVAAMAEQIRNQSARIVELEREFMAARRGGAC